MSSSKLRLRQRIFWKARVLEWRRGRRGGRRDRGEAVRLGGEGRRRGERPTAITTHYFMGSEAARVGWMVGRATRRDGGSRCYCCHGRESKRRRRMSSSSCCRGCWWLASSFGLKIPSDYDSNSYVCIIFYDSYVRYLYLTDQLPGNFFLAVGGSSKDTIPPNYSNQYVCTTSYDSYVRYHYIGVDIIFDQPSRYYYLGF